MAKVEIGEDKKIEILYDHYKDTFENIKSYLQKRFTYTLVCVGIIAAFVFEISFPGNAKNISDSLLTKKIGNIKVDFKFINALLSFGLMWMVMLYYQIIFLIEKQWDYLHSIEKRLCIALPSAAINREGSDYLSNYPILSSLINYIYSILFPLVIITVAIMKWQSDILMAIRVIDASAWFESIFLLMVVIMSALYLINRHFNDFKKKEKGK